MVWDPITLIVMNTPFCPFCYTSFILLMCIRLIGMRLLFCCSDHYIQHVELIVANKSGITVKFTDTNSISCVSTCWTHFEVWQICDLSPPDYNYFIPTTCQLCERLKTMPACHSCHPCHHTTHVQPCHHAIPPPMCNHATIPPMPSHHPCATMPLMPPMPLHHLCATMPPCHHTTHAQPCHPCHYTTYVQPCHTCNPCHHTTHATHATHAITPPMCNHVTHATHAITPPMRNHATHAAHAITPPMCNHATMPPMPSPHPCATMPFTPPMLFVASLCFAVGWALRLFHSIKTGFQQQWSK